MVEQQKAFSTEEERDYHAFVVFGARHSYLAHSAMFMMVPHSYQVIQELYLGTDAERQLLINLRGQHPQALIMVKSTEQRLLYQLIRGNFEAGLYLNSLDEHNRIQTVTTVPGRLLYYNPLNPFAPHYPAQLTYYMFGRDNEAFMSHVITQRANFHHEVTLAGPPAGVPADVLERGFLVTVDGLPDGFHGVDPLPNQLYQVTLPDGTKSVVQIYRRDRFTFQVLNG